jgi:hypothetical protein
MTEQDIQIPQPAYERFDPQYGKRRSNIADLHGLFDKAFPTEVDNAEGGLDRASEFLSDGRGLIVIMNHPSMGDHLRMAKTIFESDAIKNSPVSIAVAHHQYPWLIAQLMDYAGIDSHGVVTESTVQKGKNTLHPTQKLQLLLEYAKAKLNRNEESDTTPISLKSLREEWQKPLGETYGSREYVKNAGVTLNQGGVVVLGPQGTRSKELTMWNKRPVRFLLTAVDKRKHVGFLFVGIDERQGGKGMNIANTYGITIGKAFTYEEMQEFTNEHSISIDEAVFEKLHEAVSRAHAISSTKSPEQNF